MSSSRLDCERCGNVSRGCYAVILGGDSLKQKLDSISDTVTDNVRETGITLSEWRYVTCRAW